MGSKTLSPNRKGLVEEPGIDIPARRRPTRCGGNKRSRLRRRLRMTRGDTASRFRHHPADDSWRYGIEIPPPPEVAF